MTYEILYVWVVYIPICYRWNGDINGPLSYSMLNDGPDEIYYLSDYKTNNDKGHF